MWYTEYMMDDKEIEMISSLCGGTFELKTGIPWTAGLSRYRDTDAMKIRWEKVGAIGGRWFFEINGVQYSAKQISPHIKGIQMHCV